MGLHLATRRALLYRPPAAASGALRFDGTGDYVDCGSGATLDDLHAGAFTAEAWIRRTSAFAVYVMNKISPPSGGGWGIYGESSGGGNLTVIVQADGGTNATARSSNGTLPGTGVWTHIAATYDNAGDRKPYIWLNGAQPSYGIAPTAAVGTVRSDAALSFLVGGLSGSNFWIGDIAWVRLSNVVRYTDTFTPQPLATPPDTDANTVLLLKMDEGSGTTVTDSSGNGNHGTLYGNTTWVAL